MKQQFNVYLEPELVGQIKHRAIDEALSLSALVTKVFERYVNGDSEAPTMPSSHGLQLQPIIHVGNIPDSVRFYEALGGEVIARSRDDDWAQVRIGASEIGLLAHPPNPEQGEDYVELCFSSDRRLNDVERELRAAGVTIVRGAADEAFGEQLQIESPDGLLVKINRLETEHFT